MRVKNLGGYVYDKRKTRKNQKYSYYCSCHFSILWCYLFRDDEVILESEMSDLRSIGMSDLKGMLENNEKKVVMLGTDDCYWCVNQKPILQHIVFKYGVEINYLNLNAMTEEEYNELTILHDDLQRFGTPTFIIVDGGNITTVSEGGMPTDSMVQFLKDNGIITE